MMFMIVSNVISSVNGLISFPFSVVDSRVSGSDRISNTLLDHLGGIPIR